MNNYAITISALISFLLGIGLQESFQFKAQHLKIFFVALIIVIILTILLQLLRQHFSQTILYSITLLTCFSLGLYRSHGSTHIPSPQTIDYYTSEERNSISIIGNIIEEPDIRRDKVNYTVQAKKFTLQNPESRQKNPRNPQNTYHPITGKLLVSTAKYPRYQYGDHIKVTGHLQKPTSFDGFDYAAYLSRFGIYTVMYRPHIKPSNNIHFASASVPSALSNAKEWFSKYNPWPFFYSLLLKTKESFEAQMNQTFSTEPSSSFMAGLLLGSRKGIPEQLSEAFRITGLTHIIAISGYNITLIVTILMSLFRPLGKKPSVFISALGILAFTLFVGASPAVVRACIMGLIGLLALHSDRKGDITLTLLVTATLMVGYNPKILFHDVGFQLSFLATMGLIYVAPLLEPYFTWLPQRLAIRESILLTLSAQIMALPIIIFNFQNLSLVSPLSNLLITGPIIPYAMLFGFMGTLVSFVSLAFAKLIAFPAYLLLDYIVRITTLTAKIPYASLQISWFSLPMFLGYFFILCLVLISKWKKHNACLARIKKQQLLMQHQIAQSLAFV